MTGRDEWLEWRRGGLGASDIGALLGLSKWQSPWSLWASKVGLRQPSETSERQQMGHDFEPVLAQLFTRRTGLAIGGEQTWCAHDSEPWMRCTSDGFVFDGQHHEDTLTVGAEHDLSCALGGFEAKTDGRFGWPDGVPPQYEAQAKWSMAVTNLDRWWIGVLFAGWRFEVYEIERDADDEAFMIERARAFWFDHVVTGEQPPTDGSDATAAAIAEVWPTHEPGKRVAIDDIAHLLSLRDEYAALEAAASKMAEARSEVENRIKQAMGDGELATVGGEPVLSLRTQTRRVTASESTFRVLRNASKKDKES